MGILKQLMLRRAEREEIHMDCPQCGKDLIVDQYEDVDLVYCSCGYTKLDQENEDCMCEQCNSDYQAELALTDKEDF
jgi:ssDNA-binding Zn-finger/Zn-ribbon topoisomerase 1